MKLTRPMLVALNGLAYWCLHRVGVQPVNEVASGRNPETLRELVDHSAEAGALDPERRDQLLTAMELDTAALRTLVRPHADVSGVAATVNTEQIRDVARRSGHLRLVVWRGAEPVGVVHVRDALAANPDATAADLMRPVLTLTADEPVYHALTTLRRRHSQFALVSDGDDLLGLVTMQDLLDRLLPDPDAFRSNGGDGAPPRPHDAGTTST